MGISMLNGIGEVILGGLFGIFEKIFGWVFETLVTPILQALITAVIMVVKYVVSGALYQVSIFILNLIDFVELLFKTLAGLGGENVGGNSLTMSINGEKGDLLIQFLKSPAIIDVFLAMCIVGLFLLIMTTIFQMIKVEYTTEGANNSKMSILSKSLKSIANLLLIPILVVFGVVIGNSVLDLLDTATSGSSKSTISGTIFVACASNSMYKEESSDTIRNTAGIAGEGITRGLKYLISFGNVSEPEYGNLGSRKNEIEANIKNQTIAYSDVKEISRYYDVFNINYLVLIFGGCIIVKSLYHVCFGMIDRIYQCVVLFIVSPVVVGMSPVKDSLGSWRSRFISKALSAYGYIVSLNLFFIIVDVMLSIDIRFSIKEGSVLGVLGNTFLAGLLQSILVIVGCLMIEKVSGDIGSYFGGGNAASDGKALASEATDGIKKAAVIGGSVALGAGSLAIKGAGLAGKMAKGAGNLAKGADRMITGGKIADGLQWAGNKIGNSKPVQAVSNAGKKVVGGVKGIGEGLKGFATSVSDVAHGGYSAGEIEKMTKTVDTEKAELKQMHRSKFRGVKHDAGAFKEKENRVQEAQDTLALAQTKNATIAKERGDRAFNIRRKVGLGAETLTQMASNTFGLKEGLAAMGVSKGILGMDQKYKDAQKQVGAASGEMQAIIDAIAKKKSDEARDKIDNRHKGLIGEANARQEAIISKAIVDKLNITQQQQNAGLDKLNNSLNDATRRMDDPNMSQAQKDLAVQEVSRIQNAILQMNKDVKFNADGTIKGDFHLKLDTGEFQKKIAELIKKNAKTTDFDKVIEEQLKKWGEVGNVAIMKELQKVIEEIKNAAK